MMAKQMTTLHSCDTLSNYLCRLVSQIMPPERGLRDAKIDHKTETQQSRMRKPKGCESTRGKGETIISPRNTESLMTFHGSFTLSALKCRQPPETCRVVDEEQTGGLSFVADRRTATFLHIPAVDASELTPEVFVVDPEELAAIIRGDTGSLLENETMQGAS